MITEALDAACCKLEEIGKRPFWRMVQLFVARIFRGGGDADAEGLDLGIGLVLTLLAIPGGFVSILLLNKYGTFLQWLRGQTNVDPLLVALPDEYFFIVLSMTVTGAVAVWRWDAIFPDRRDYMNLVPLPISTRTIFFANLVAVLFLVGLVAADVNAASCILFPMVVGATQTKFLFFVKFAVVHAIGVLLASVFAFFAVFSIIGLLMAVLPPRAFRRFSSYFRGVVVICLVALLCSSFAVPTLLRRVPAPRWAFLVPSCWFLGLCQSLRGRAGPMLVELSKLALPGLAVVVGVALCAYAVSYQRHFVRIVAGSHTLLVVAWTVLLTNIILIRFRKIPFTCTLPLFKQHSFVTLLSCCFGFLLYAMSTPEFESSALAEPVRMLSLAPAALVMWYIPHHLAKSANEIERRLIFEESPTQTIEALRLSA